MKAMNFKLAFMMALAVCATAFVSCSSDDDKDNSNGGGMTSKRIVKETWSDGDEIETVAYEYDSKGRVVKVIETNIDGRSESSATTTYTYGESTIISKSQSGETHTYTLSDGRIIKEVESYSRNSETYTYTYAYDNNGYLISQKYHGRETEFIWTDGNMTKMIEKEGDGWTRTSTYSYSSIAWPQNWMQYWDGTSMDKYLEPLGAWGKMPKNLPTKYIRVQDDGYSIYTEEVTLDYTIENGEVTKVTYHVQTNDDYYKGSDTEVVTFEWK